jgi:sterol desaturase/sphingolipid hydroxylase (fatty acid hydroxylase superfamily)
MGLCIVSCGIVLGPMLMIVKEGEGLGQSIVPSSKTIPFIACAIFVFSLIALFMVWHFKPKGKVATVLIWTTFATHILILLFIDLYLYFYKVPDFVTTLSKTP